MSAILPTQVSEGSITRCAASRWSDALCMCVDRRPRHAACAPASSSPSCPAPAPARHSAAARARSSAAAVASGRSWLRRRDAASRSFWSIAFCFSSVHLHGLPAALPPRLPPGRRWQQRYATAAAHGVEDAARPQCRWHEGGERGVGSWCTVGPWGPAHAHGRRQQWQHGRTADGPPPAAGDGRSAAGEASRCSSSHGPAAPQAGCGQAAAPDALGDRPVPPAPGSPGRQQRDAPSPGTWCCCCSPRHLGSQRSVGGCWGLGSRPSPSSSSGAAPVAALPVPCHAAPR